MRVPDLTTHTDPLPHSDRVPAAEMRYGVAQVTEEARDGWRDFADRFSIDRAALAEVIGKHLANMTDPLPEPLAAWVVEAKELKNLRRRR